MRVNLVVVGDPRRQLTHHGLGIRSRTDADVIAFDRADEGFSHSVALRTFDGRRSWFKTDVASEAARIASNVAAAVVRQPSDSGSSKYRGEPEGRQPTRAYGAAVGIVEGGDEQSVTTRKLSSVPFNPDTSRR